MSGPISVFARAGNRFNAKMRPKKVCSLHKDADETETINMNRDSMGPDFYFEGGISFCRSQFQEIWTWMQSILSRIINKPLLYEKYFNSSINTNSSNSAKVLIKKPRSEHSEKQFTEFNLSCKVCWLDFSTLMSATNF